MNIAPKLPCSLKEVEEQQQYQTELFDLNSINIESLNPAERNRLFTQLSATNGEVPAEIRRITDGWIATVANKDPERYQPKTGRQIVPSHLPRSQLIDTFFSHQIPGIQDSILTDVRRLVRLQCQIKQTAEHGSRQIKLAMHHLNQIAPEAKLISQISTVEYNPFESIGKMIEEDEPLKKINCITRLAQTSVSVLLENTDGITADYTNGNYQHPSTA
ncbi:hypothetical protein TVAG_113250 [Trichomonas vaginalis G3]|uniref:Uncharacterized protein n=1 Tax=Trichomonas vaginalis (strain ATCC PRA-98 / G3) TaxID=412133 RepID=A2DNH8_TRIV3|nr:hypothetical protein TVAGG3_0837850 [Trichomonas vaginalis G3]EAY17981.1 hypothetical protein TVAG_113250 [Trichomonas vaginalis G3]KAI5499065.1 hypothetical protein TVAGG3_0837850 [Trichomonas vaginalis G3]|eukprot:XP_001578967.1 hypothetical protein [Trichomonas vaginalis G3]